MKLENAYKIKLLKILEILRQDSDEDHYIETGELLGKLSAMGIVCDRRTLAADIETLNNYGYEVLCEKSPGMPNRYCVADRSFSVSELRIMMDAVQASCFVTPKKTEELVDKIAELGGSHRAELLRSNIVKFNTTKSNNENIFYNISEINAAIENGKKVSFQYFDYDENHEHKYRKEGKRYFVNPLATIYDDDNYINNYKNNMQGENMMNNNDLRERYPFNVINCIFGTHDCFPKDEETAEELIKNQEFWTDYEKVLNSIDDECKSLVTKHFKDGQSLAEIAAEESISYEEIDARCAKALRQLRHPNRANFLKKYIYRGIPMINFNISSLTAIQEEKIVKGIEKYMAIKKLFNSGISLNDITNAATFKFQKLFNSFYRVRRNEKWRKVFYDLFDDLKANKSVQFDAAFNEFTQRLQACNMNSAEKSFVSKMVHTINNDSPIIDGNVLKGLHIKGNDAVKIYGDLREIYTNELLPNAEAKEFFADFDKKFPNGADMSKVKKIDFYLWALFAKRYSQSKIIVVY